MVDRTLEIDIAYNDYFMEVYTIDRRDMKYIIPALQDDEQKSFTIGDKTFLKKDLNSVSIADHGLGFIFMDVTD